MFGFNKNREENQSAINEQQIANADNVLQSARPEIREEDFIDTTDPNGVLLNINQNGLSTIRSVDYSTGLPIDGVFWYMEKDWEEDGMRDAIGNPDINYMNMKIEIIKQGLVRRFEMTRLRYNKLIRDCEAQMESLNTFGLTATLSSITSQIDTYKEHIQKLNDLESRFQKGAAELLTMTESYKRGFANGVAQRTQQTINSQNN